MKRAIGFEVGARFLEFDIALDNIHYVETRFYLFNGRHKLGCRN
ncbi:MAG: hypothetical protein UW04_C0031G0002 [Parcubacteria group bacterium GW2011_GWB1_43_8]|nr:MAG: hypothetical protein UW04_C0031G0002 [Parcubacteria group bacterium GW2011_GWB1_43_8]KKU06863.1 MAG: hypothetical protein UX11_C0025G0002 [Candidatus Collierbacteria bacterium GW2011_GWC2_45_40]